MSRVAPPQNSAARQRDELEDWISAQPSLCAHSMRILGAYRAALARAGGRDFAEQPNPRPAAEAAATTTAQSEPSRDVARGGNGTSTSDDLPIDSCEADGRPHRNHAVPRLRASDGLDDVELSRLHGRLIALGLLTEEVVSRKTGIAYRLTREGIARLNRPDDDDRD